MERELFFKEMKEKLEEIKINLTVEQLNQFYSYMNLLIEWNEKINLTSIIQPDEIIVKHFVDSLTIIKNIKDESKIVDVGTGAGFPGIPLSIVKPNAKITLVDSLNKRLIFLEEVIRVLNLKNVELVHARAEEFGQNKNSREKFDIATSRAVANLSTLSEYLLPLLKINGIAICMKSLNVDEEINISQKAIKILGGKIKNIDKFKLPHTDIGRAIITIEKCNNTPSKYPRKAGIPSKDPLN